MFVVDLSSIPDFILECLHSALQSESSSTLANNLLISDSPSSCLLRDASHSAIVNSWSPVSLYSTSVLRVVVPPAPVVLFCAVMRAFNNALFGSFLLPEIIP